MADAAFPAAAQVLTLDAPEASINGEPLPLPSAPAAQQQ
jgi:hypothetical protein